MSSRQWEGEYDAAPANAQRPRGDAQTQQRPALGDAAGEDSQAQPEAPKPPQRRKRNVLSESHLLSSEGLKKIVETFPYQVQGGIAGQEADALNSLIKLYKQWAYDLYPGLNFEDFVDRTEALGKTHAVQGLMSELRTKHMRRAQGISTEQDDEPERDQQHDEDMQENELLESRILAEQQDMSDDDL